MPTLTKRMSEARKSYIGSACKIFFPFNEGSGSVFTDLASNIVITATSVNHDTPHAPLINHPFGTPTSGVVPSVPDGKSVIWGIGRIVNQATNFSLIVFGTDDNSIDVDSGCGVHVGGVIKTTVDLAGVNGQSYMTTATWNGSTGEIRSYTGQNGGSVAFDDTADASAFVGGFDLDNQIRIGSGTFNPNVYAAFMYVVDELPSESEIITQSDWMYQEWLDGHKVLPKEWVGL